ncbi:MAG: polymer-forming cytoskeletal protein [Defluviitaleaceae bacterium]|nr:polymer-forming cytoskeletal protein [Defluviitaleaceae bacterium]
MFFKKSNAPTASLDAPNTVIGKGMYLEAARLSGNESVRIDGIYKGQIDIDGSLVLGDSGSVAGDVRANYFLVAGEVTGNINCSSQLHFASTAKIFGDVQASSLIVDEGAQVSGKYAIGAQKVAPEAAIETTQEERLRLTGEGEQSGLHSDEQAVISSIWHD